jgi:hypothetical protein
MLDVCWNSAIVCLCLIAALVFLFGIVLFGSVSVRVSVSVNVPSNRRPVEERRRTKLKLPSYIFIPATACIGWQRYGNLETR